MNPNPMQKGFYLVSRNEATINGFYSE